MTRPPREVDVTRIEETVARLCQEAAHVLPDDVYAALRQAASSEQAPLAREVLTQILENAVVARQEMIPLCQDTGTTVVFLEIGQDVHLVGGDVHAAVNGGVARGYAEGYLRASIVDHPITSRVNTRDNTPAVIHTELVPGDRVRVIVVPKGGGCENMSRFRVMLPAAGAGGIRELVLRTVEESGGNPCPPLIVGVGVGGTAEHAMYLAKRAILRPAGEHHPDPEVAAFERELLAQVNATGVGPQNVGGMTTALAVNVEVFPTHIASLPVAINLQCHSARQKSAEI